MTTRHHPLREEVASQRHRLRVGERLGHAPWLTDHVSVLEMCAVAALNPDAAFLTPDVVQGAFGVPTEDALLLLGPSSPLRRLALLERVPGHADEPLARQPVRVPERVLHWLIDDSAPPDVFEPEFAGWRDMGERDPSESALTAAQDGVVTTLAGREEPHVLLWGAAHDVRGVAARLARMQGQMPGVLSASDLARTDVRRLAALLAREFLLTHRVALVTVPPNPSADVLNAVSLLLATLNALPGRTPCRVGASERLDLGVGVPTCRVPDVSVADREALWRAHLTSAGLAGEAATLARTFGFGGADIASVVWDARSAGAGRGVGLNSTALHEAARARVRARLDRLPLVSRARASVRLADLVLPDAVRSKLDRFVRQARLLHDAPPDGGTRRGRAVTLVMSGPSGTGKTTAAEAIANELNLDLYRVDLSKVVDKYVGETEKHLSALLDAAEGGGCVLLFDEADALFGRRGEVREARDRYANQGVNFLLGRLEVFTGLMVLTTNLEGGMDEAFTRRMRVVARFRLPSREERERLWRAALPPGAAVNVAGLSALELSGASIASVAFAAALDAQAEGTVVSGRHLHAATRDEFEKLGRLWRPELDALWAGVEA